MRGGAAMIKLILLIIRDIFIMLVPIAIASIPILWLLHDAGAIP